eukprot:GSA25T00022314001.1
MKRAARKRSLVLKNSSGENVLGEDTTGTAVVVPEQVHQMIDEEQEDPLALALGNDKNVDLTPAEELDVWRDIFAARAREAIGKKRAEKIQEQAAAAAAAAAGVSSPCNGGTTSKNPSSPRTSFSTPMGDMPVVTCSCFRGFSLEQSCFRSLWSFIEEPLDEASGLLGEVLMVALDLFRAVAEEVEQYGRTSSKSARGGAIEQTSDDAADGKVGGGNFSGDNDEDDDEDEKDNQSSTTVGDSKVADTTTSGATSDAGEQTNKPKIVAAMSPSAGRGGTGKSKKTNASTSNASTSVGCSKNDKKPSRNASSALNHFGYGSGGDQLHYLTSAVRTSIGVNKQMLLSLTQAEQQEEL